jgi:hypothetical protein
MWQALTHSVSVARNVRQAEQLLRGGVISDALVEFGDVMVASARTHLAEARTSPDPRRRVEDAAAALQDAYHAYERATRRGAPPWLRRELATRSRRVFRQYSATLGKTAGSAAGVAVLRAHLGEPPATLRKWLDRVAEPVALERSAGATFTYHDSPIAGGGAGIMKVMGSGDAEVRAHLISYFTLERLLLPPEDVRPLPQAWTSTASGQVVPRGAEVLKERYLRERFDVRIRMGAASDQPGKSDIILQAPDDDVIPVFAPDA